MRIPANLIRGSKKVTRFISKISFPNHKNPAKKPMNATHQLGWLRIRSIFSGAKKKHPSPMRKDVFWVLSPTRGRGYPIHNSLTGVFLFKKTTQKSIKNWMGPYQRTPKEVARAIRFSGLGVRSVGPVGDFLEKTYELHGSRWVCPKISGFYPNEIRNWGDGMFGPSNLRF